MCLSKDTKKSTWVARCTSNVVSQDNLANDEAICQVHRPTLIEMISDALNRISCLHVVIVITREHSDSANLRQGQNRIEVGEGAGGGIFHGMGHHCWQLLLQQISPVGRGIV